MTVIDQAVIRQTVNPTNCDLKLIFHLIEICDCHTVLYSSSCNFHVSIIIRGSFPSIAIVSFHRCGAVKVLTCMVILSSLCMNTTLLYCTCTCTALVPLLLCARTRPVIISSFHRFTVLLLREYSSRDHGLTGSQSSTSTVTVTSTRTVQSYSCSIKFDFSFAFRFRALLGSLLSFLLSALSAQLSPPVG